MLLYQLCPKPTMAKTLIASAIVIAEFLSAQSSTSAAGQASLRLGPAERDAIAAIEPTLFPTTAATPATANVASEITSELITIHQAFDETLLKSPRADSIRRQLGITQAAYAQALTFSNPSFLIYNGFRAEQTYQVGSSIPVEPPWKVVFRLLVAKQQVKQADLEIARALWALRSNVRRTYLDVVLAKETAATITQVADLTKALYSVAQRRFAAGDVAQLDVERANLAFLQAEIDRKYALRRVLQTRQRLSIILGRFYKTEFDVSKLPALHSEVEINELLPDFGNPLPDLDVLLENAIKHRLELKIVNQSILTNQAQLKNAYGNIIPNAQFNIGSSITGNPPIGPKIHGYFLGVTQELPVFNLQQADIARLRATIKQLGSELKSQKNIVVEDVVTAYQRVLADRERIHGFHEHVLEDSDEVSRLARLSYEVGQLDITATLAAQQANVQVRSRYLEAVQAYQQGLTDLEIGVGMPL